MKRGRCVQCRRRLGSRAVHLYNLPDGSAAYLCGRRACEIGYNGGPAEPCDCRAHRKAAAA